jgi:hypothetical protein
MQWISGNAPTNLKPFVEQARRRWKTISLLMGGPLESQLDGGRCALGVKSPRKKKAAPPGPP